MQNIHIRDNETGEVRVYKDADAWPATEEEVETRDFVWSDGNYACDCNRGLFFGWAAGEEHPETTCGSTKYTVWIEDEAGRRVYEDDDAPAAVSTISKAGD